MDATIQKTVRNSELCVAKEQRTFLTHPANGLMACIIEETEDSVCFIFNSQDLEPATAVLEKPEMDKLRFLANCAELEVLNVEYAFSMCPDNLLADINLIPKVMQRDVVTAESTPFIQAYKALVGSVLQPKYKYEDYLNGGEVYYKKSKLLAKLTEPETVAEIRANLLAEYLRILQETNATKKLVPITSILACRIAIPLLAVALVAVTFFAVRMRYVDIPFRDSVVTASAAYIDSNFLVVQQALKDYDVSELSIETRRFLSRSYVATEALSEAQRQVILIGLAQRTEPIIFDFWIHLGRLNFDYAIDIAQRLGDDELLLFAYVKQDVFVRHDLSIPGEERQELLSNIERNIDRINRAREEATGAAAGFGN